MLIIYLLSPNPVEAANAVINEFVPNSSQEWVEFYNASSSAEYLKSYFIDDDLNFDSDSGSTAKKSLSSLVTGSLSYPYLEFTSMLNNGGDYVVLFDSTGNIVDQYQYTADPGDNISIGRSPDDTGGFATLISTTKGSANSEPIPTPTSTAVPTPTLVPSSPPTQTPSTTPTPAATPTIKPTATLTPANSPTTSQVLGDSSQENEINLEVVDMTNNSSNSAEEIATPTLPPNNRGSSPLPTILMAIGGVLIAGFGSPLIIQELRARKNSKMNR